MTDSHDLFLDRVLLLTDKRVRLNDDFYIHLSGKYSKLFGSKYSENITLREVANCVNHILVRKEEHGDANFDKWGRFDHNKSALVQNELDQAPIIDELILDIIKQLGLKVKNVWPGGKRAAVCLTHDVDAIDGFSYLWLRQINWYLRWFRAIVQGQRQEAKNWISILRQWKQYKRKNVDPMDSFEQIRELEDTWGFRSTFFLMSLRYGMSREGRRYNVKNPKVGAVSKKLLENGWEIGLHAAYHNHLSTSSLKEQKQRLEEVIREEISGCRHHYLRVKFPDSWEIYAQSGLKYSSNMGWGSGFQGFRAGTCLPYQPLEQCPLLEIPFQLMDTNPIADIGSFMNIFYHYLQSTKTVGGCLVINFHQEHFQEKAAKGVGKVYRNMVEAIARDQDVVVLTMNQVCKIIKQITE